MNQYINEQAVLYVSKLKNEGISQTHEGHEAFIVQKSKAHLKKQTAWLSILLNAFNLIRGKRKRAPICSTTTSKTVVQSRHKAS